MAKIFVDANIAIDILEKRKNTSIDNSTDHIVYLSPLTVHIMMYVLKKKVPSDKLAALIDHFSIVPFNGDICINSLHGPTEDFEDNVQLHSAVEAECDYFLTEDKELLKLRFFGKMELISTLS